MAIASLNTFRQSLGYNTHGSVSTKQLSEFIAWLSLNKKKSATISAYVAGVSFFHKLQSLPDPANCYLIRKIVSGLRRVHPTADKRLPISYKLLHKLVHCLKSVTNSTYERILYSTAFILSYFGFLRLGEFTANTRNGGGGLAATDVSVLRTGGRGKVMIDLRHSKNSQFGRTQTIVLHGVKGPICPVQAVEHYLAVRPQGGAAFLCHFDKSPLTRHQLQAILRKAATTAGLDSRLYTPHSFRIGAATAAAAAGCSPEQIMEGGRWRSSAYRTYIRYPVTVQAPV